MRTTLAVIALIAALATAPAASPAGDPAQGCELFGSAVASAQPFYQGQGPGAFGQEMKRLSEALGGNPLEPDRQALCP